MVSHLDKKNNPIMVDISKKNISQRIAEAEGEVQFDAETFKEIESLKSKKGSINNIAVIAGIMGAKETSRLIPLCHNIPIDSVNVEISKNTKKNLMKVKAIVKTSSRTGVEMEALTAVAVSCLTIYDMCKYLNKSIKIDNIKLISKKGGKSGVFKL
ncbi:cyclic pyranopterin monophosphate synthase MoaC [Alphaproteobacteria bacterium]|nr:cyclic pyranopterin monophosphate synthase MoaC [Alphaproteobacteria bacterium]